MSAVALTGTALTLPARYVSDLPLLAMKYSVRLRTILGTWPDDADFGLPWDRWIRDPKRLTAAIFASAVRAQLEAAPETVQVVSCVATQSGGTITLTASVFVRVAGQTGTLTVTTDPLVRVGAPSFLTVRGA